MPHLSFSFVSPYLGALLLFLHVAPAEAQVLPRLGVSGGVNFATLDDARTVNLEESVGYHAGAFVEVGAGMVGLRVSALYMKAGNVRREEGAADTSTVAFVTIPVDVHLRVPLGVGRLYLGGGPEARIPIGEALDGIERQPVNLAANAVAGIGLQGGLFVEGRYAVDVTGYASEDNLLGMEVSNYRLNTFMLRLGLGL